MKNRYVTGFIGSDRYALGRQLAEEKGMDFLDRDRAFEARYHYTVSRFFEMSITIFLSP